MGDHVGLGEVAGRAETVLQLAVEVEVDIDLLVARAIERPHGGHARAAGRTRGALEQNEGRIAIARAELPKGLRPHVLGGAKHDGHETLEVVIARRFRVLDLSLAARDREIGGVGSLLRQADVGEAGSAPAGPAALQEHRRIDAEEQHQPKDDQKADNADAATAARGAAAAWKANATATARKWKAEAAAFATPVLDILALSLAAPPHLQALAS